MNVSDRGDVSTVGQPRNEFTKNYDAIIKSHILYIYCTLQDTQKKNSQGERIKNEGLSSLCLEKEFQSFYETTSVQNSSNQ